MSSFWRHLKSDPDKTGIGDPDEPRITDPKRPEKVIPMGQNMQLINKNDKYFAKRNKARDELNEFQILFFQV